MEAKKLEAFQQTLLRFSSQGYCGAMVGRGADGPAARRRRGRRQPAAAYPKRHHGQDAWEVGVEALVVLQRALLLHNGLMVVVPGVQRVCAQKERGGGGGRRCARLRWSAPSARAGARSCNPGKRRAHS
jgi:hypothetical protein